MNILFKLKLSMTILIYNPVTGSFMIRNVSSTATIKLLEQNAATIVLVPAGGKIN